VSSNGSGIAPHTTVINALTFNVITHYVDALDASAYSTRMSSLQTEAPPAPRALTATPTASTMVGGLNWTRATWLLLVVVCGALFLDGLDLSMIGVALPSIGHSLHLSAHSLQWIVSGYVLGYGSFLLLGGRTSDLISRRTVFLVAVSVFGVASLVSACLSNEFAIVALRFIKGASAGFTVPAGLSILTTTFAEGPARNKAFGIYTLCGASGFSLGLVFGGLLTEIGWRATFLLPGPVALALVAIGWRLIPRVNNAKARLAHFDLAGALSSTASLLLLVYTVVEAPSRGWASTATIASLGVSAALMATFVMIELRHDRPLVRLGILRTPGLVHANVAAFAMFGSYAAFQFIVTLYVQDALGWSPITMALAFLPAGAIVVLMAPRIGSVIQRVGTPTTILFGMIAFAAGYAWFLRATPSMSYVEFMLPTMILIGIGFGLSFAALNAQATAGVANHEQGLASGLLNTSLQIGGAIVLAVVSAILGTSGTPVHDQLLPGMTTALDVIVGLSAASALLTALFVFRDRDLTARMVAQADDQFDGTIVENRDPDAERSTTVRSARAG
jgi:MFS family permease